MPTTTSGSGSLSTQSWRRCGKGIPEDAFVVWDVTQFGYYARTHWQVNHPKTYIDSGYSFNLGYAIPDCSGVKVASPDRPVLCVTGDGGFMFNSSELSTAVQYGINLVTVVFRNDSYGNVARDLDEAFRRRPTGPTCITRTSSSSQNRSAQLE